MYVTKNQKFVQQVETKIRNFKKKPTKFCPPCNAPNTPVVFLFVPSCKSLSRVVCPGKEKQAIKERIAHPPHTKSASSEQAAQTRSAEDTGVVKVFLFLLSKMLFERYHEKTFQRLVDFCLVFQEKISRKILDRTHGGDSTMRVNKGLRARQPPHFEERRRRLLRNESPKSFGAVHETLKRDRDGGGRAWWGRPHARRWSSTG